MYLVCTKYECASRKEDCEANLDGTTTVDSRECASRKEDCEATLGCAVVECVSDE